MKIREALKNWKNDESMAILAIETLKQRGIRGKRLQMFCQRYMKESDTDLSHDTVKELINKAG